MSPAFIEGQVRTKHLLNLLAAIAILVWGTRMARTGILRVFGASSRQLLSCSLCNRFRAVVSGCV